MNFVEHNALKLEYKHYGNGSKVIFAFHGFGRHAIDFKVFQPQLENNYTIYAFNLFHHGKSQYPKDRVDKNTLRKEEWLAIIEKALNQLQIDKITLMGYSLGGKLCLQLVELMPQRIEHILLYAPDGIKKNFWYYFASNTALGQKGYRFMLKNPQLFFKTVSFLKKTRVINEKIRKFAINNMDSAKKRELVYTVWLTFKETNPNIKKVASNIQEYNIAVDQFFGRYDRVIPLKLGIYFARLIDQRESLHVLEKGHSLLTADVAEKTASVLLIPNKKRC